MIVAVNRLTLKSLWVLPRFLRLSGKALKQAKNANGNMSAIVRNQDFKYFWSFTTWQTEEDMKAYFRSGAHLKAIKRTSELASGLLSTHREANSIPSLSKAHVWFKEDPDSDKSAMFLKNKKN